VHLVEEKTQMLLQSIKTCTQRTNIVGVSLDKDAAKWKEAIAKDKLTWTHVSNLKFWDEPIAAQYGVQAIPATFILDAW
jgi:hypothetical protein